MWFVVYLRYASVAVVNDQIGLSSKPCTFGAGLSIIARDPLALSPSTQEMLHDPYSSEIDS
mgnify:CR=1 FL=1